ncbi:MAG: GNAT family N-acetyltransferase, partial [Lachnospiraceae bacterium]|nr:GNAT family N-acetyltransferase [Lachnospiraceae bacterium]
HIWKSVFGDSEAFIEEFLNRMQEEDTILLYCVEGKPVSMACFLPITIKGPDSETDSDARYVYAVATLPEYRNRGFIRKLLAFAEKEFHQPLVLSPAEPDLYAYYEKLGFRKLYTDETEVTMIEPARTAEEAEDAACVSNQKLTPSEYKKLRDSLFTEPGTFQWNEKSVDFIYYYYGSEETHAVSLTSKDGEEELLMYRQEEDSLKILENTLSEEELQAVLTQPAMYKALGLTGQIKQTSQYHPGLMIWDADETTYFLTEGHGYFNFSLGD